MTEENNESKPEIDPFAGIVRFYDTWSKTWAKAMSEAVSSQSFAESVGRQMESSLEVATLARKQLAQIMEQSLQQMSLPTRGDVVRLAERLTKVEMALDDIDARLDEVLALLKAR